MPGIPLKNIWSNIAWAGGVLTYFASAVRAALTFSHAKRLSYEKPLIDRHVTLRFQLGEIVGKPVGTETATTREEERQKFWQFCWVRLVMVEGPRLEKAMVAMGKRLREVDFTKQESLSSFAFDVSRECREQIETTLASGWQ